MSGKYSGAQGLIRQKQPLAVYVHCGTHCVKSDAVEADAYRAQTPMEHYRVEYYKVLDRFQQDGLLTLQKLENTLLTGKIDFVVDEYPDINTQLLAVQLPMFRLNYPCSSSTEAAEILAGLPVEVRGLFTEIETQGTRRSGCSLLYQPHPLKQRGALVLFEG